MASAAIAASEVESGAMAGIDDQLTILSTVRRSGNLLTCSLGEEGIAILNIDDNTRFSLDPIGERIWNLLESSIMVRDIITALMREYDVQDECCESDTLSLLHQLHKAGMIEITL